MLHYVWTFVGGLIVGAIAKLFVPRAPDTWTSS
jgi:hypothetical protein